MPTRTSPEAAVVVEELRRCGVTPVVEHGGKHIKVRWKSGGLERCYTAACTTSDHRAILNCRSEVRRILLADGVVKTEDQPAINNELARRIFDRIDKLEREVEYWMSTVLAVMAPQSNEAAESTQPTAPTPTAEAPPVKQTVTARKKYHKANQNPLLELLSSRDWMTVAMLSTKIDWPRTKISGALVYLQAKDLVENSCFGWRRKSGLVMARDRGIEPIIVDGRVVMRRAEGEA